MPAVAEHNHHDALSLFASRLSRQHRFGDDDLRLLEAALSAGADVPALLATRSAARRLLQQRAREAFATPAPLLDHERSLANADFFARAFALVGDVESCLALRYEALLLRDANYSDNHHLQVSRQEWLTFAKDSLDNGFYTIASKAFAYATPHVHRSHPGQLHSANSIENDKINDIIGLQNLAKSLSAQRSASHASQIAGIMGNIEQLNGSNYASWKEKLEITLALLDIDYALHNDAPVEPKPEDENYEVLKKEYDEAKAKWDISNRKCLMIIRSSIIDTIRGAIPDTQTASGYLAKVEEQFKGSSKVYATTLIKRLVGEKYDATGSLREHIMKKCHMAAKLKAMEMEISDGFLVHFIMSSLPQEFSPFVINYNSMKVKWGIDELIAMCVQEEERLKADRIDHANQIKHSEKKKYKKFKKEYMKPKPTQFKEKGQCSNQSQQNKCGGNPNSEEKGKEKDGCYFCGKSGHRQKDCIGFMRWLSKKGIRYEEDPKKRGKKN